MALLTLGSYGYAASSAPPPLRIDAHVDRWSLAIDEELDLRVEVHGVYDRYIHPSFPDFELIGSYKKKRSELRNGKQYTWREVHYRLRPNTLDRLVIGGASIKMGGKVLAKGQDIVITVTNPPPSVPASQARDISKQINRQMILRATSDKDSYWVGEPIVVSWDLISKDGLDIHPVSVERAPRMEGISRRENLVFETQAQTTQIAGQSRRMRHYSRVAAFKTQPGKLVIDAMRLLVRTNDDFGKARLVTRPFHVSVKALPKGQPSSFAPHQVGSFKLTSRVIDSSGQKATSATAGDVLYLEAQVQGRGNIRGLKAPKLLDAEHFDVQHVAALREEVFNKDGQGIEGTRQFRFKLTPRTVGDVPLPKVRFAFFDPKQEAYVVRTQTHGSVRVESVMQLLYGGQLLEGSHTRGVRLEVGWPHASLTYVLPVIEGLEISPKMKLRFGRQLKADTVAVEPGVEIRWSFLKHKRWRFALYGDPALVMEFPSQKEDMELGLRLGVPGVLASVQIDPSWNLSIGLRTPLTFMFGEESRVLIPLLADIGIDTTVVQDTWNLNVGALLSAGPEFCVGSCEGVEPHLRFSATTSLIW